MEKKPNPLRPEASVIDREHEALASGALSPHKQPTVEGDASQNSVVCVAVLSSAEDVQGSTLEAVGDPGADAL